MAAATPSARRHCFLLVQTESVDWLLRDWEHRRPRTNASRGSDEVNDRVRVLGAGDEGIDGGDAGRFYLRMMFL